MAEQLVAPATPSAAAAAGARHGSVRARAPEIAPIGSADLPEFADFLHRHLHRGRSAAAWEAALRTRWEGSGTPDFGLLMRDAGDVVGGIAAFRARRRVGARTLHTCNISSWCVLDGYRQHSMRLAVALVGQPGLHVTDFSPTPVVASTLRFLGFRSIDSQPWVIANLPRLPGRATVLDRHDEIAQALQGEARRIHADHAAFEWLHQLLVGVPGDWCHVIYKRRRYKGLPSAEVLHAGAPASLARHAPALLAYFLRRGLATTQIDQRLLPRPPGPAALRSGFKPKLFLSDSLREFEVDTLYSETMALDL